MDVEAVPNEGNATLAGERKAVYARNADGRMMIVASRGWEVEEIVTRQAVHTFEALAESARRRVRNGLASPLEYWMYARRMDTALLAQASGFWQWRVRRHLRPAGFARLSARQLARYAEALALPPSSLREVP